MFFPTANKLSTSFLVSALLASTTLSVSAQAGDASSKAAAESLFSEARTLMQEEDYKAACEKMAASYELDPATGTLLNLAVCHEKLGKLATAWSEYRSALSRANQQGNEKRATFAREAADRLEPRLPRLLVLVTEQSGDLTITINDVELSEGAVGSSLPVDPGRVVLVAKADGYQEHRQELSAQEAKTLELTVPALVALPPEEKERDVPTHSATPPMDELSAAGNWRRPTGWVLGGVGVAGVAAGTTFGLIAIKQKSDSDELCNDSICSEEGLDKFQQSKTTATLSTIGFGVGAAGLGLGIYFLATSGSDDEGEVALTETFRVRGTPLLTPTEAGYMFSGSF